MRILLISSNITNSPYPVYPLGLGMVASALKKANHEVSQFDFLQNEQSFEILKNNINMIKPEIIGISIRNIDNVNLLNEQYYIDNIKLIVQCIRANTHVLVVLGGCGFSIMPEIILNEIGADYGIVGEGEELMTEFVNNAVKNIFPVERCIRAKSNIEGKKIPSAQYDSNIMEFYLKNGNIGSVQTKRGCTHKCIYCSYPILEGSTIRVREPKAVVDDISFLINTYKIKNIFFTDSVFNDENKHYIQVLEEMKNRNIFIPWIAFFKPEKFSDSVISLMKETGLKAAEIGVDATSDVTLSRLGKSFRFTDVIECNELLSNNGIATAHYYMFGCPGENEETVYEGIKNIKSLQKTVSFIFMGVRILPATPLAELALKEGLINKNENFLSPIYYIASGVEKKWLEKKLTEAFSGLMHCVFPPDAFESRSQALYKLGYSGPLWDMIIPGIEKRRRRIIK